MLLDDIATYMAAQSTAFTKLSGSAGNLSKAYMPDASPAPDTLVTLYETGGLPPTHTFTTGGGTLYFENPRLQVLVRSSAYTTARNLADKAYVLLDSIAHTVLPTTGGTMYLSVSAVQSPFSIGRDENGRYLVSCNFDVQKLRTGLVGDPGAYSAGFSGGFA